MTFCSEFAVKKPIVLAPMAGVVTPELVAAVSNAGGLGLAPLWQVDVDELRLSIKTISRLTPNPFGVNLNMDFPSMEHLDACLESGVSIISLFWHMNEEYVRKAKSAGAKVIFTAGSAKDAEYAVQVGVDAICAQGWEAGGHVRGTVGTMALVPAVKDAVGDVPVIAAGGIADGRGIAAAFALGASAVWVGTRFLSAFEAQAHPEYLKRLFCSIRKRHGLFQRFVQSGVGERSSSCVEKQYRRCMGSGGNATPW
ncbi:nitronate monooxygenase [Ruegeria hyattellae]|uniref:nitronate monooxygenase n=1 Tax=Ruegeria hyattellae TaxID=3233337 RepID=UPI00355B216E